MLPLPCITTIRKYISMVGLKCSFDENFFKAFKMKIFSKPQFQRRGMLIFDEIQVRKEISVNSKTMTYTGLVTVEKQRIRVVSSQITAWFSLLPGSVRTIYSP